MSAFSTSCFVLSAMDVTRLLQNILVECQLKITNIQGDQATAKRDKMLQEFKNSSTKTIAEQSVNLQAPLASVMEFARRS
jgi:hypothetical protein